MTNVERIEAQIAKLSPEEVRHIARWFAEHHAELWDAQIEEDAEGGRLDFLFEEADAERKAGKFRRWPPTRR